MNKILVSCIAIAVIAAAAAGIIVLNHHSSNTSDADDKEVIAVTMSWEQDIVEQIVGDNYKVVAMLGTGSSPHTAEVTPENIKDLNSAVVYFEIGSHVEWETALEDVKDQVSSSVEFVNLTETANITLLDSQDEDEPGYDPHVWTSLGNLESIATAICDKVCQMDPDHSSEYKANLDEYKEKADVVDTLVKEVCELYKSKDLSSWSVCVWHPAWQYFCQYANETYGTNFQQVSVEISDGSVTPEAIEKLIEDSQSKTIFVSTGDNGYTYKDALTELGITVHVVSPTASDMLESLEEFIGFLKEDLQAA